MAFKQVIICEKGTQAKLFVKLLNLNKSKSFNGVAAAFYDTEDGICVVHQSGHLLELMPPQYYAPGLSNEKKGWNIEDLPVMPALGSWKWKIKKDSKPSLDKRIKGLFAGITWALKGAGTPEEIILAVDNDQEGELLGWEVIDYLGQVGHPNITRMLYSQLTIKAVKKAYDEREPGSNWYPRYQAGLARLFADWIMGMNITIALTVINKEMIPRGNPLHSGRVIFAVCYIIYRRHLEIINFKPQNYYNEVATFKTAKGETYVGRLQYPERYLDAELKKLTSKDFADKFKKLVMDKGKGQIANYEQKEKKKGPPIGFHRTGFDVYMSKKYGMDLKLTATCLQKLYSDLGLITYPRVSVKNLDVKMHVEMPAYLSAMAHNLSTAPQLDEKQKEIYQKAFKIIDTAKVSAIWKKGIDEDESHHAIIPTDQKSSLAQLSPDEFIVYKELADRLIIQFLPDYEYMSTAVETRVGPLTFKSAGTTPKRLGWKGLALDPDEESEGEDVLPPLEMEQVVDVVNTETVKTTTTKPKLYTQATLLLDLESPGKFVSNKDLMKKIKKLQIGTDGTREPHIAQLAAKGFISYEVEGKGKKKTKYIQPTKKLISSTEIAPDYFKLPETSAYWEDAFISIKKGEMTLPQFYAKQGQLINRFFNDIKHGKFILNEPTVGVFRKCHAPCGGNAFHKVIPKKDFDLWVCAKCDAAYIDDNGQLGNKLGQPRAGGGKAADKPKWSPPKGTPKAKCPDCEDFELYFKNIEGKSFNIWECQSCEAAFFDSKGKPDKKLKKK